MNEDVIEECTISIEKYGCGLYGLELSHNKNRLLLIKLKDVGKLWDMNKGYDLVLDQHGNFTINYNQNENKICKECGRKLDE